MWHRIGANRSTIRLIQEGYQLNFKSRPPRLRHQPKIQPPQFQSEAWTPPALRADLSRQVAEWLRLGVVEESQDPAFVSALFGVPKKDSTEARPILDTRRLNLFLTKTKFQMDTFSTAKRMLLKEDWLTKVDLTKAYWHIRVAERTSSFLHFYWEGRRFRWKALPFGVSDAPRAFTLLLRQALKFVRQRQIRVVAYIDDLLILARSVEESIQATQFVVQLLESLGFLVNHSKSVLEPTQEVEFLGMVINTATWSISLRPKKRRELRHAIRRILKSKLVSGRLMASIVGKINACQEATPAVREHLTACRDFLRKIPHKSRHSLRAVHKLPQAVLAELKFWEILLDKNFSRPIRPPPITLEITTDSSGFGWGGWACRPRSITPIWEHAGQWNTVQVANHITWKELKAAVECIIKAVLDLDLRNTSILLRTDNLTALSYLLRRAGRKQHLNRLVWNLWRFLAARNLFLQAVHLKGILNVLADKLSRLKGDPTGWMIRPSIFAQIQLTMKPTLDLFASETSHQLARFCSRSTSPKSIGNGWTWVAAAADPKELLWIFPPFNLLLEVLHQLSTLTQMRALLIFPDWKAAPWWPILQPLLLDSVMLPQDCLLLPPDIHPRWKSLALLQRWRLHCGILSSDHSQHRELKTQFDLLKKALSSPTVGHGTSLLPSIPTN